MAHQQNLQAAKAFIRIHLEANEHCVNELALHSVSNQNWRNQMLQWHRWNWNWTEPEPSEPDFGVYIGTKKLNFGLEDTNKYFEDSYGCSFSRGIRWC